MSSKTIVVIGAGATGMTATKQCLEQGFKVVVLERTNYTGGLWRYQDKLDENGTASVMKSTVINSSKEMSAFSDFPPPPDYPNYMHNTKMVAYFDRYGDSFGFTEHVRYRTEVVAVEQAVDHDRTGRWTVTSRNLDSGEQKAETFDGVMVCTGHHGTVNEPTFPGQEQFTGTVMHTHSLKTAAGFEDKTVVVVGIGNSGGDAAVELATVAKQVYLSTRRGTWVTKRVGESGRPSDTFFHRRYLWFMIRALPYSYACTQMEKELNRAFDHEQYRLKPAHRSLAQHVMVNDTLPNRILSGTVAVKADIDHFTADGVVFRGESEVTKCDAVILATGYRVVFPFLSDKLVPVTADNRVRLYKHQFVPDIAHPHTLALIGLIQPIGALLPISEMQSRWYALLMAGKRRLPSVAEMWADIDRKERAMRARYYDSDRHTIQVDWVPFMDELATEIGCFPPWWRYLFTDFKLFLAVMFGPIAPYQYRLTGPNSWPGARQAVLTVEDRIAAPLHTKQWTQQSAQKCTKCGRVRRLLFWTATLSAALYAGVHYSPTVELYWNCLVKTLPSSLKSLKVFS